MTGLIDVQEPGDVIFTMGEDGELRAFRIGRDGHPVQIPTVDALKEDR